MKVELKNKNIGHNTGSYTIDQESRIAYVEIPKSGSSTLRYLCEDKRNIFVHRTIKDLSVSDHTKTVVFVRHPYGRFISAINQYYEDTYKNSLSLADWLPSMIADIKNRMQKGHSIYYDEHFVPQCYYAFLFHNVSYIKLENMADYFKSMGVNIPRENQSNSDNIELITKYIEPFRDRIMEYYKMDLNLYENTTK